jgi:hypothetical protein
VILLLPVAWLLHRGVWWAAIVPLATSILVVFVTPPAAYPTLFVVVLLAVLGLGVRDRRAVQRAALTA